MKALILAAGMGTRLRPLTDSIPKCMVQVNGESIIHRQMHNLHNVGIDDVVVVSGYRASQLTEHLCSRFPSVTVITNNLYESTNNMYSAYLARHILSGEAFILMNGDVYHDPSVLLSLISHDSSDAIVVEPGRYMEESMKVRFDGCRITEIGKQIPETEALGVSTDIYKLSTEASQMYFRKVAEYVQERGIVDRWNEVALNDIFYQTCFSPCPLVGRWIEIDSHEDLRVAQQLFR